MTTLTPALLLATSLVATPQAQDSRTPVPSADAQAAAEKTIRDVFKAEYAKGADRRALARRLAQEAGTTKDDPVSRYVLLRDAQDAAVQAGDIALAFQAIEDLATSYQVAASGLKTNALASIGKNIRTPEDMKALSECYLQLASEALAASGFEAAEKAADSAGAWARKAKDLPLVARADARQKLAAEGKKEQLQALKATDTLVKNPDDVPANLIVGRFLCLVQGDWATGLPYLEKAKGSPLQEPARKDLSASADAAELVAAGDAWWEAGEKDKAAKTALRKRAITHYRKVASGLTGLPKVKVEKRLTEFNAELMAQGSWIDITDPSLFGAIGKKGDPVSIPSTGFDGYDPHPLKSFPVGVFDGFSARVDLNPGLTGKAAISFDDGTKTMWIKKGYTDIWHRKDKKGPNQRKEVTCSEKQSYGFAVLPAGDQYLIFIDNLEVAQVPMAAGPRMTTLTLMGNNGVKFDQLRLRRKD
jgi:hypothetical protein